MKVFKFGGASVKDAEAVRNVASIIREHGARKMIAVISAMGKTTNALEELIARYLDNGDWKEQLVSIEEYHEGIARELFDEVPGWLSEWFDQLTIALEHKHGLGYDAYYDQIVPFGELISTTILVNYLKKEDLDAEWLDARKLIVTDDLFRDATVDWKATEKNFQAACDDARIYVLQGFIGATTDGVTTTLGREGSDFSAGIAAYSMDAASVTIWKDVPGMLNADPKWFDNTERLPNISYHEAVELAYYGASVIHPKTIKPLQNKHIPLEVRSFVDTRAEGTLIDDNVDLDQLIPSFIFRMDQVLISISARDYAFIVEKNLSDIFDLFAKHHVKINLMQNSAISFSVCVDRDDRKLPSLIEDVQKSYKVLYNEGLELVTIRHYDDATIDRVTVNKDILVKQFSRHTARLVMKDKG